MNLLTNYVYQYNVGFQYHFGIAPFLIYVAIINMPELKAPARRNLISIGAAACACLYLITVVPKVNSYTKNYEDGKEKYVKMEEALDSIPKDASVVCSSFLLAHLADRDEVYELNYHANEGDVDFVVFDGRYSIDSDQYNAYLDQGYELWEDEDNFVVILKKAE